MNGRPVKPTLAGTPIPPIQPTRAVSVSRNSAAVDHSSPGTATPFRPLRRPPMAVLEILFDGLETGEQIPLRADVTTIGRAGADITIGHDAQISGTHVSITRQQVDGDWHWILKDLNSTNGTFLRVARGPLGPTTTVLMGAHRYRYRAAGSPPTSEQTEGTEQGTQGWKVPSPEELQGLSASLVRLFPDGSEQPFQLAAGDVAIGSDPEQCQLVISDDPMLDAVHAQLSVSGTKQTLEDRKSVNGIWVSVKERRLAKSSTFQIGEQRLRFRTLP